MSTHPTDPNSDANLSQQAADSQAYRQILHELIEKGTSLAQMLHQQAVKQAGPRPAVQLRLAQPGTPQQPAPVSQLDALLSLAAAFDNTARTVCDCITLARTVAEPRASVRIPVQQRAAARRRIIREVEDAIGRAGRDGDEAELQAKLDGHLDAPQLDLDISTRPIAGVIADICRDLGLVTRPGTQHWRRRTPADIERLCARAAAPSRTNRPGALQDAAPPSPVSRLLASPEQADPAPGSAAPPPTRASGSPPDDRAGAAILRHPTHIRGRWRPLLDS